MNCFRVLFLLLLFNISIYAKEDLVLKDGNVKIIKSYYNNGNLKRKDLYIKNRLIKVKEYYKEPIAVKSESFSDDKKEKIVTKCYLKSLQDYTTNTKVIYEGCMVVKKYQNNKVIQINDNTVNSKDIKLIDSF